MKVLVTGANGFVGRTVVDRLLRNGAAVNAAVRKMNSNLTPGAQPFDSMHLDQVTDWSPALRGVQVVIHCAARVHVTTELSKSPLAEFRRVNVVGMRKLVQQSAAAGVRRFIFLSSIGVNGAETFSRPFHADDRHSPHSPYAIAKLEAEEELRAVAACTSMEVVIIRPPMVYGPGARGNFAILVDALRRGIPLPLGSINNRRSLVALDNLADLLVLCAEHPAAAGQVFLVSDNDDVSTTTLLRRIAVALACPARLFPVYPPLLRKTLGLIGRSSMGQSLCGSLQLDISKTHLLLNWSPVIGMQDQLEKLTASRVYCAD